MDHYLGKMGVNQITDFRDANPEYKQYWNAQHITGIDIIMKETEDCAGRTGFYDSYGVIRDVHQNHLTEVFNLVAMEEAADPATDTPDKALQRKAALLDSVEPASKLHTLVCQYGGYKEHVQADKGDPNYISKSPTMALSELQINSERWKGMPVNILGGKMLHERRAYVKVQFVPGTFGNAHSGAEEHQLVFHIQGGVPKHGPRAIFGKALPAPAPAPLWSKYEGNDLPDWAGVAYDIGAGVPDRPYDKLLWAIFRGQQDFFVGTKGLLASWRIWDKVLHETAEDIPLQYPGGTDIDALLDRSTHCNGVTNDPLCEAIDAARVWFHPPAGKDEL